VVYAVAADPPAAPPAPVIVGATDSSVTIDIPLPLDDGGQSLTKIELFRDAGDQASTATYEAVTSYSPTSFSPRHVLTTTVDGLATGKIYRFKTRASNPKGDSADSELARAAVVSPPAALAGPPQVDRAQSGPNSLYIRWTGTANDPSKSPGGDLTGY
jgi:hypothetical protein